MKNILLVLVMLTLTSACTSTYNRDAITTPSTKLETGTSVAIATPDNGRYGHELYTGSGTMTAGAIKAAFARYSNHVTVDSGCQSLKCLLREKDSQQGYYVVPQILHWEDRATEWSGKKDKVEIKITVYDRNKKVLASSVIAGKSKWATFGGDHPQDLLPEPIDEYVGSLYE